jgi:hypothetical protein
MVQKFSFSFQNNNNDAKYAYNDTKYAYLKKNVEQLSSLLDVKVVNKVISYSGSKMIVIFPLEIPKIMITSIMLNFLTFKMTNKRIIIFLNMFKNIIYYILSFT